MTLAERQRRAEEEEKAKEQERLRRAKLEEDILAGKYSEVLLLF